MSMEFTCDMCGVFTRKRSKRQLTVSLGEGTIVVQWATWWQPSEEKSGRADLCSKCLSRIFQDDSS